MTHNPLQGLGVLVVAYDLPDTDLNGELERIISQTRFSCPVTAAVINENTFTIQPAISELNRLGAERIVVVPLMSGWTPEVLQKQASDTITITQGFEQHVLVKEILTEREDKADSSSYENYVDLETLLPHPKLARLIEWRVAETIYPALAYQKDGKTKALGFNEAQAIAVAAGASYPCSTLATRVLQLAFQTLWDDLPRPAEMDVISHLPPEVGSRPVIEAVVDPNCATYTGDWYNVTSESPTFVITNRVNGRQLRVTAKPSTYGGEEFFALRHKHVNGQGDQADAARVKEYFQVILSNLLLKPNADIFDWEVTNI